METLETELRYFLQRDIVLSINNKILKEGKLVIFNQKDYYYNLYLKVSNTIQKKIELPYPFAIKKEKSYIILDYTLNAISKNDTNLYYKLMALTQNNNSRFYNNKILLFEKNSLDLSIVT